MCCRAARVKHKGQFNIEINMFITSQCSVWCVFLLCALVGITYSIYNSSFYPVEVMRQSLIYFHVHLKSSDTGHLPCCFFPPFFCSFRSEVVSTFSRMVGHLPILIALSSVFSCALEPFLFLHPNTLLSKLSCPPFTSFFTHQLSSHVSFTSFELFFFSFFFFSPQSFVLISLSIWRPYEKGALVSRAESSGMTLLQRSKQSWTCYSEEKEEKEEKERNI